MGLIFIRFVFVLFVTLTCYYIRPFGQPGNIDAAIGALLGIAIIIFEWRLRRMSLPRLIGAAIGSVLGIFGAYLFALVIRNSIPSGATQSFLQIMVMLLMAYVGLIVGANKGELLNLSALGGIIGGEAQSAISYKILDTSVIIDGRIADIAETGFLDGTIVTPQFVLHELQLVADSADSLKRNRGRRGLDVLQRLQKMATINIQIVEDDFPSVREVDLKLIELAKLYKGKIITNDFNLNKVAQLQGVDVLNINELANSLKPIVLPGEIMKVFILKEGKEYNQGVAYLDDGTMVVVDNARKAIGKTVDVSVTSVLQTTAGKMIFGRWDERSGYRNDVRSPELRNSEVRNNEVRNHDARTHDSRSTDVRNNEVRNNEAKNNEIRNGDIRNNEVRAVEIRNNDVRNNDVRNSDVRNSDVRPAIAALGSAEVKKPTPVLTERPAE